MLAQSKESNFRSASSAQSAVAAQANLTAQMSERISDTKRRNLFVTSTALDIHCFNVHLQRQSLSDLFRRHGELIEALADGMGDGVAGCGDDRHHHHLPQPSGR